MTEADVLRYNAIPSELLTGAILEIGARYGEAQLASRHRDRFLQAVQEDRYVGIDVLRSECTELPITDIDFFELSAGTQSYDHVLMLEVAEHICLRDWPRLFTKIRGCLRPGGSAFVTVPFKEQAKRLAEYLPVFRLEPMGGHVVYGITPGMIRLFLPGAKCHVIRKHYPFKTVDESWFRALARFGKRVMLHEPLAWNWLRLELNALVVVWSKPKTKVTEK